MQVPKSHRVDRLQGIILQEVRTLMLFEMDNPLLSQVSITRVMLTKDLSAARIYYDLMSPGSDKNVVAQELKRIIGTVRKELAQRLQLRAVPKIDFFYDETNQTITRVEKLIDSL